MQTSKSTQARGIGQLATELGITPQTIRYYEAVGLLALIRRSPTGYRQYSQADCDRIRFILQAKHFELTLHEISDILAVCDRGELPCLQLASLFDQKIAAIDKQVRDLRTLRSQLMRGRKEALAKRCALGKLFGARNR